VFEGVKIVGNRILIWVWFQPAFPPSSNVCHGNVGVEGGLCEFPRCRVPFGRHVPWVQQIADVEQQAPEFGSFAALWLGCRRKGLWLQSQVMQVQPLMLRLILVDCLPASALCWWKGSCIGRC